jgi:hypothetical protein
MCLKLIFVKYFLNYWYMRLKVFVVTLVLLTLNTALLYAQTSGIPCAGVDVDSTCPLDTWVVVLAGIAFLFAIMRLHRKNLAQTTGADEN